LEITETSIVDQPESVETLRRLADMGVVIALDDFGTGYSNLSHLRSLPVRAVKLAGAFVDTFSAGATGSPDERIVRAMLGLCHSLNLTVTAEGVESRRQAESLANLGCGLAQGWLYGAGADRLPDQRVIGPNSS